MISSIAATSQTTPGAPGSGFGVPPGYADAFAYDCDYQSSHALPEQSPIPPPAHTRHRVHPSQPLLQRAEPVYAPGEELVALASTLSATLVALCSGIVTIVALKKHRKNVLKIAVVELRKKRMAISVHRGDYRLPASTESEARKLAEPHVQLPEPTLAELVVDKAEWAEVLHALAPPATQEKPPVVDVAQAKPSIANTMQTMPTAQDEKLVETERLPADTSLIKPAGQTEGFSKLQTSSSLRTTKTSALSQELALSRATQNAPDIQAVLGSLNRNEPSQTLPSARLSAENLTKLDYEHGKNGVKNNVPPASGHSSDDARGADLSECSSDYGSDDSIVGDMDGVTNKTTRAAKRNDSNLNARKAERMGASDFHDEGSASSSIASSYKPSIQGSPPNPDAGHIIAARPSSSASELPRER